MIIQCTSRNQQTSQRTSVEFHQVLVVTARAYMKCINYTRSTVPKIRRTNDQPENRFFYAHLRLHVLLLSYSLFMSFYTTLLFSVDPDRSNEMPSSHLGRLDYASLSQQTLMELLIEHIEEKAKIRQEDGSDIDNWDGIDCNEDGNVTLIDWFRLDLHGKIDLQWVPSTVIDFSVSSNWLKGSADISHLPTELESLFLDENSFSGTLDLTALPDCLERLNAFENKFSGSICLTCLPSNLGFLKLSKNSFSGTLDLTSLPDTLAHLDLSKNEFHGCVDFSSLPDSLSVLYLSGNALLEGFIEDKRSYLTKNTRITRVPVAWVFLWRTCISRHITEYDRFT